MEICHFCLRQCHCSGESEAQCLVKGIVYTEHPGVSGFFKEKCKENYE